MRLYLPEHYTLTFEKMYINIIQFYVSAKTQGICPQCGGKHSTIRMYDREIGCISCLEEKFGDLYTCENCEKLHPKEEVEIINRGVYCKKCIEEMESCCYCGSKMFDYTTDRDGDIWCESCTENYLFWCEKCEKYTHDCNINIVQDEIICDKCLDSYTFECYECGERRIGNPYQITHDGKNLCESCYYDNYSICNDCEKVFHTDDLTWDEEREIALCENCSEFGGWRSRSFNKYTYEKPQKGIFRFGIEIELNEEPENSSEIPENWGVHYDCTAGSSYELVSPPMTLKQFDRDSEVNAIFRIIRNLPVSIEESVHIHIGNFLDLTHAMCFVNLAEESMHVWHGKLCSKSRQDNQYCIYKTERTNVMITPQKVSIKPPRIRYFNISTDPWFKYETIEIRAHQATMNRNKIKLWIELWKAFYEMAKYKSSFPKRPDTIEQMCEMLGIDDILYVERAKELDRYDCVGELQINEPLINKNWNTETKFSLMEVVRLQKEEVIKRAEKYEKEFKDEEIWLTPKEKKERNRKLEETTLRTNNALRYAAIKKRKAISWTEEQPYKDMITQALITPSQLLEQELFG